MKIFIDTGNFDEIKKFQDIIDGVTTNPTLIAKEDCTFSFEGYIAEIAKICPGPISIEAISTKPEDIIHEAKKIVKIVPNSVIKIPISQNGLIASKKLAVLGIKTNVTLIFSVNQAILAAKAGATYASIFVGRLDDIGLDGMKVVRDTRTIYDNYQFSTEIIAASIRTSTHVTEAALAGAHVSTIPPAILDKLFNHPLTDRGLAIFNQDWEKSRMREKR